MRALWAKDVIALRARVFAPTGNRRCCARHHLVTAGSRGGAKNSGMAVASPGRPARGMRRAQRRCDPRAHGRSPPRGGALRNASEQRAAQGRQVRWLRKEDPPTVRRERVWGGMLAGLICLVLPVSQAARYTAISDRRCSRSSQHHPQPAGSAPVRLRVLSGCCCGRCTRVPDEAVNLGLSGAWRRYLDM